MNKSIFIPDHKHFLLQGYIKKPITKESDMNTWLENLVNLVRMKVVAGPMSKYVSEPGNEGVTGIVSLATSHAALHIWDNRNPAFFQFDLYSCTKFTPEEIIEYFENTLEMKLYKYIFIDRNNFNYDITDFN